MKYTSVDAYQALANFTRNYPKFLFDCFVTGSTAINREGEDIDICVKCKRSDMKRFIKDGYEKCGDMEGYKGNSFMALRKDAVNLILVFNKRQFTAWEMATTIFKTLYTAQNFKPSKLSRIQVFEYVRKVLNGL